ncbi:MAG: hypothetical protein IJI53_10595 [Clostridia bacterium]|nr:hypothetical protein [Clostridia bacterium]
MTIPDYLIQATADRYGSDVAVLVEEYIHRWATEKLPEDSSHLSTELYRLAYPYFAAHEALSSVGIDPDEFIKTALAHQPDTRAQ